PEGRPTIFQLLPKHLPRVLAVGRLDFNTEGLLLRNQGEVRAILDELHGLFSRFARAGLSWLKDRPFRSRISIPRRTSIPSCTRSRLPRAFSSPRAGRRPSPRPSRRLCRSRSGTRWEVGSLSSISPHRVVPGGVWAAVEPVVSELSSQESQLLA
ncbi:MAG: hypothetical protein EBT03_10565, partial [Betaproteobacteria bacterium]|nr:hypothetical protein [Betaproteobacteria bacterium]